ncbi:MAG: MFS transporter [Anaerolineae bacterium]
MDNVQAQGDKGVTNYTWVLVATILASSMAFISSSALNVALPALQRDLGVSGAELLWIVNAYLLFLSALILVGGSLGDHYGRKRIFTIGILIFLVASTLCGLAMDTLFLIIMRAVQGVGAALMVPGSLAIITATFPSDKRGEAIGTWSTFSAITTVGGPLVGGFLAQEGLWRAVFFINLPLGAIALFALFAGVPETRDENISKELDYVGALLVTLGLAGLTFGFIQAPDFGWSDPRIVITLGGGLLMSVGFVLWEARTRHPMVPLALFKSRTFSGTNAMTLFLYAALTAVTFFLPLNLIQVQGYGEAVAGSALLPFGLILAVMSRWAGGLVDRVGPRLPLVIGPIITGIGFVGIGLPGVTGGAGDYWTTFFPGILLMSIGMGITVAPLTTTVMGAAPQQQSGTASGINNAVSRTAGVLATAILGAVALIVFSSALQARTADLALSEEARTALMEDEAPKLAEAQPPASVTADLSGEVQSAIDRAFVETFRLLTFIGAGLAFLSALISFFFITEPKPSDEQHHVAVQDSGCPVGHPNADTETTTA